MKKEKKVGMIIDEISSLEPQSDKISPIFVNFKHAKCNPEQLAKEIRDINVEVTSHAKKKPDFNMELTTWNLTYETSEDGKDPYFDHYIAIRDKETGKTRLIEAVHMTLKPKITAPQSRNSLLNVREKEEQDGEDTTNSRNKTNQLLVNNFGMKKSQAVMKSYQRQIVHKDETENRLMKAANEVKLEDLSGAPDKEDGESIKTTDLIPKRDDNAALLVDVYKIQNLLSDEELTDLSSACTNVLNQYSSTETIDEAAVNRTFTNIGAYCMKKLLNGGDVEKNGALVLYLETIVKFSRMKPIDLSKGYRCLPNFIPQSLKKKVFENFSVGEFQKRIITPELKDKAVCHAIVLALLINDFKIEVSLLTDSMRIFKNLENLVNITGAHVVNNSRTGKQEIILKRPLAHFEISKSRNFKKKTGPGMKR